MKNKSNQRKCNAECNANSNTNRGESTHERINAALNIGLICVILIMLTAADLWKEDRLFSKTENRVLASKPELRWTSVLDGSFMKDYETYVTDQFVGRDRWIGVKTMADMALQKKEINGVYLGKDDYLMERHPPEDYPEELAGQRLTQLKEFVERWDAKVMLVPTADNILTDKLPAFAENYNQRALLDRVEERVGKEHMIDVYEALFERRDEEIYYRTDHHWTSRGAYYGYLTWADAMGEAPDTLNSPDGMETVSEDFYGTLHSKLNIKVKPDVIEYFPHTEALPVRVVYDLRKESASFYEESYLETKNQYGFFLDDNHAFIEIDTGVGNGRTLFMVKDSYANCMIPLLASHYEKLYVVDLRYMNGKLFPFMESYEPESGMDVLVLYNCVHFLEEFQYW